MPKIPYLQLDSDFIHATSKRLAVRLRRTHPEIIGMVTLMLDFAIDATSTDETPPNGILLGPDAPAELEAAAGWGGEPGAFVMGLIGLEVIDRLEMGVRVRGMKRYEATWRKRKKERDRYNQHLSAADLPQKDGRPAAEPPPVRRRSAGETETETDLLPSEEVKGPAQPSVTPDTTPWRSASDQAARLGKTEPTSSVQSASELLAALAAAWEAEHPTAIVRDVPRPAVLQKFLLEASGVPVGVLARAYRLFLQDPFWSAEKWPWRGFAKDRWKSFVLKAAEGSAPARGGRMLKLEPPTEAA